LKLIAFHCYIHHYLFKAGTAKPLSPRRNKVVSGNISL